MISKQAVLELIIKNHTSAYSINGYDVLIKEINELPSISDGWISEIDKARFWSKVKQTNYCWEWTATMNNKGYGVFRMPDRQLLAHRVAFSIINGPVSEDLLICHKCDNPCCVNPSHLFSGTHQDNMIDMYSKGRGRIQGKSSTYLGVGWRKDSQNWRSYVAVNGKLKNIGVFATEKEASDFRLKYITENKLVENYKNSNSFTLPPAPTK